MASQIAVFITWPSAEIDLIFHNSEDLCAKEKSPNLFKVWGS